MALAESAGFEPFSLEHFREWSADLVLDNGCFWVLEPFQEAFIGDVLAGYKECWLVIPEGNGKTTLIAAFGLYHCQFTVRAAVSLAASAREQAEVAYYQAAGLVENSPALAKRFRCYDGYRRVVCKATKSRIQVKAADDRTGDGIIPTLCLVDELHRHRDLKLYRTWVGKLRKRQGQIVTISTSGEPGSEFEENRETIRQQSASVERGETFLRAATDNLVLHEWALPEAGDPEDLELVKRANPLEAVSIESLRESWASPTMTLAHWRRFVCNLPTRAKTSAITEAEWDKAVSAERVAEGDPVWLGLDVAWKWDTTALVPYWYADREHRYYGDPVILTPPRDGTSLDPNLVERAIIDIHARNPIHTVVMDMSRAEQLASWIESEIGAEVVDRPQSNAFAAVDYDMFTEALRNGWLFHTGHSEFRRHVLNAVTRILPNGGARFDRPSQTQLGAEQDRRVIDALTAAAMAHSTAMRVEDLELDGELVTVL